MYIPTSEKEIKKLFITKNGEDIVYELGTDWGEVPSIGEGVAAGKKFRALFNLIDINYSSCNYSGVKIYDYQLNALLDVVLQDDEDITAALNRINTNLSNELPNLLNNKNILQLKISLLSDETIMGKYPVQLSFVTGQAVNWEKLLGKAPHLDENETIQNQQNKPLARLSIERSQAIITAIKQSQNPQQLKSTLSSSSSTEASVQPSAKERVKKPNFFQRINLAWQKKMRKKIKAAKTSLDTDADNGDNEFIPQIATAIKAVTAAVDTKTMTSKAALKNSLYTLQQMQEIVSLGLKIKRLVDDKTNLGFIDNWRLGWLQAKFESKTDNLFREVIKLPLSKGCIAAIQFFLGTMIKWVLGSAALGAAVGTFVMPGVGTGAGAVAFGIVGGSIGLIKRGLSGSFGADQRRAVLKEKIAQNQNYFIDGNSGDFTQLDLADVGIKTLTGLNENYATDLAKFGILAENWKAAQLAPPLKSGLSSEDTQELFGSSPSNRSFTRSFSHFMLRHLL